MSARVYNVCGSVKLDGELKDINRFMKERIYFHIDPEYGTSPRMDDAWLFITVAKGIKGVGVAFNYQDYGPTSLILKINADNAHWIQHIQWVCLRYNLEASIDTLGTMGDGSVYIERTTACWTDRATTYLRQIGVEHDALGYNDEGHTAFLDQLDEIDADKGAHVWYDETNSPLYGWVNLPQDVETHVQPANDFFMQAGEDDPPLKYEYNEFGNQYRLGCELKAYYEEVLNPALEDMFEEKVASC